MAKHSRERWHLNRAETDESRGSFTTGFRTSAQQGRSADRRDMWMKLTHRPTGIFVEGKHPFGYYDRKDWTRLTEELRERLFVELEKKVARNLRIPGR